MGRRTLGVRALDASPADGDVALRIADGKRMVVSTSIQLNSKGMILCNLVELTI